MRHGLRSFAWTLCLLLVLVAPVAAAPADLAAQTAAVEAALADKDYTGAEALAEAALAGTGGDALAVANLHRLLGDALYSQERFAEAEPHYRQALATREAELGMAAPDTAVSANDLALSLKRQQRYDEAEPYYREVIDIRTAAGGPDDPKTADAIFWLAMLQDASGRYADAAATMGEAVASATVGYGPRHPKTVQWMGDRAAMLHDAGDLAAAEPEYVAAEALGRTVFESGDTRLADVRQGLANLYWATDRAPEAIPLYRLALAAREAAYGPDDRDTVASAYRLGRSLWEVDEVAEAEALFRRVLAAREASDGADALSVADVLRWIGRAATAGGRDAEAEIVFKRVLAIVEAKNPPGDVMTGFDLIALGQLYSGQRRYAEARPLLERAVAIMEASPDAAIAVPAGRMALSFVEHDTGHTDTAITLAEQSLTDIIALKGPTNEQAADVMMTIGGYQLDSGHPDAAETQVLAAREIYRQVAPTGWSMLRTTGELGRIRLAQGRLDEALALDREALAALTALYGEGSPETETAISEVGRALLVGGDAAGAASMFEQSAAIVERLAAIDSSVAFEARTGEVEDQAVARAGVFDALVKSWYRQDAAANADRAFVMAQRVIESQAARALAQMAARQAAGDGALAALVRERQDLVTDWRKRDAVLTAALSAATQDAAVTAALRTELADADGRIRTIDAKLASGFPEFAKLQSPTMPSLADVQARLGENDVLLFFADTTRIGPIGFETFLWAVPKYGTPRWLRIDGTSGELVAAVRELRQAMGVGSNARGPKPIAAALQTDRAGRVLQSASELYARLFDGIGDMIAGRDLVIVPSKSLSALPFHALVSALPDAASTDRFRDARWLARDHAVTILPSVASLGASSPAAGSDARAPYLAFANPLLLGSRGDDRSAFARTACAPADIRVATADAPMPPLASLFRGASADVAEVRALPPLAETTDEVCAIAKVLGSPPSSVHLADGATEAAVKALSAEGKLAAARVLHFATHGLIAGDLAGLAEPAIVLSPPTEADATDDGLLTASEVATLKLDADWVVLSACNTAAGDGGGEALSGLARAFFYAGARALLVSHWPVNSEAAVRLTTGAFTALDEHPEIGRAEALRRAMVAEIDRGGPSADPANWAPFILVGASR